MAWPPTQEDKEAAFKEDGAWLANTYQCPCGTRWTDQWSCMCDDDCPSCGTTCSPETSEEIELEDGQTLDDIQACDDCGAVEGTPEWGTVGDGSDGKCPSCADRFESDNFCPGCGEPIGEDHTEDCEEAEEDLHEVADDKHAAQMADLILEEERSS